MSKENGPEKKRNLRLKMVEVDDFEALEDYTIIEPHEREDVSKGGIIIPDKAKKDSWRGTVVAVGPGKIGPDGKRTPIGVEVGDVIIYRNFLGWKMGEVKGKEYFAVSGEERIARIPRSKVVYEDR